MYRILKKQELSPGILEYDIEAPRVAKKALPGQFIVLRVNEEGERVPLTIADFDRERGIVTILVQVVGASTDLLASLKEGDSILDFVGPLGQLSFSSAAASASRPSIRSHARRMSLATRSSRFSVRRRRTSSSLKIA